MWTPDVYQGAPTPVTAFMGSATKAAAFAALLRIFVGTFPLYGVDWRPAVWGLAVVSLVVGTVAAIVQTDVKRMLAYSSISHAGFVLIGVQVATRDGTSAALFYLLVYAFMVIGAFGVIGVMATKGDRSHDLGDYKGLAFRQPLLAGLLTVFLLAQAGVPLTGGFVAKLGVFKAAVDVGPVSARTHRDARVGGRRVRLPAHRRDDVRHRRRRSSRPPGRASTSRRAPCSRSRPPRSSCSACSPASCSTSPATRRFCWSGAR